MHCLDIFSFQLCFYFLYFYVWYSSCFFSVSLVLSCLPSNSLNGLLLVDNLIQSCSFRNCLDSSGTHIFLFSHIFVSLEACFSVTASLSPKHKYLSHMLYYCPNSTLLTNTSNNFLSFLLAFNTLQVHLHPNLSAVSCLPKPMQFQFFP